MSDGDPANAMFNSTWKRDGGFIPVPENPGIGVSVDTAALKAQTYEPRELQNLPMREGGSVGYSV
jgi:galactonate dehydratase